MRASGDIFGSGVLRAVSCRPRGPSDRPLYDYYDLELAGSQAPRLPAQSLASRLLIAGVIVCCCGIVAVSLLTQKSSPPKALVFPEED